jgi:spore coat protein U-like protein
MKVKMSFLVAGILGVFCSSEIYAQNCGYQVDLNYSFSAEADSDEQVVSQATTITRPNNSPTPRCKDYQVYFGKGNSNSYQRKAYSGNESISYNIYADASKGSILKDYPDATPGEFLEGSAPSKNTPYSENYYVSVPDISSIFSRGPGVYVDVIPINYYAKRNNGNIDFQTSRYISIQIRIPRYVELSLVPENAPHNPNSTSYLMNFGLMSDQEELGADLRVVGNVGFGVLMSSSNGSKMLNGNSSVDYQIKVGNSNGGYRSLSPAGSLHQVAQSNSSTSLNGKRYNLKVRLGAVDDNLESGVYDDVITITIQSY